MHYQVDLTQIQEYNTHPLHLNHQRGVLLVIEMQEAFRSKFALISDEQIKRVQQLIAHAKQTGMKVIYVRHNDSAKDSEHMINWWGGDKIELGSNEWQIIPELQVANDTIIDKNQYSAFYETNLHEMLQEHKIQDVVICGVMTNCCCETAARAAFMRGYNVFFVSDATATINAELHLATLKNIAFGFGKVLDTKELTL